MLKTISIIRKQVANNKHDNLYSKIIYRKFSPYITFLFLKLGISANTTTWLSVVFAFIGCFLISLSDKKLTILGFIFIQFWYLLDHVDGELARYTNTSSREGLYLDLATHALVHPIIYFSFALDSVNNLDTYYNLSYLSLDIPIRRIMLFCGFLTGLSVSTIDLSSGLRFIVMVNTGKWKQISKNYTELTLRLRNSYTVSISSLGYRLWHNIGWNIFFLPGAIWFLTLGSILNLNHLIIPLYAFVLFPLAIYSISIRVRSKIDTRY